MTKRAYLAFGSNIGEGEAHIREAWQALSLVPGVVPKRLSNMYITEPWGYADQPDFTNACGEVETTLSPEALLGVCLGVEAGMGRIRQIKNGPRIIDIDLLLYEGETRCTQELILPHPRMTERAFVLVPLMDLAKNGYALDLDVKEALASLSNTVGTSAAETEGSRE